MMPTRLQDGVSVSLLQWMRSAARDDKRAVVVRINEMESVAQIREILEFAGLSDIELLSAASLSGTVTPEALSQVAHCVGVCSITESRPKR